MDVMANRRKAWAKTLATAVVAAGMLTVFAGAADAAPKSSKCPGENFQIVNGKCVSDGRAEKLT